MAAQERLKAITKRNAKVGKKHQKWARWTPAQKMEVVKSVLATGNMRIAAAMHGVGYDLVREWKGQAWWAVMEAELRSEQDIELDAKLTQIVDKSLDATLDRVENGDFIYDQKSGEIRRKPANLRDVHRVAVDTLKQRQDLRVANEDTGVAKITVEEQLKMLADNLAQWVKTQKPVIELNEVEDAVYEEREAGLQEGEREVQLSPGERSEASSEEPSPLGSHQERGRVER